MTDVSATAGAEVLERLLAALGPELVDAALGVWLARRHRERPRLLWARPEAPARAEHYLAFVREMTCGLCGAPALSEPHHYGPRALGQKTDDYRTAPVCRRCHDQVQDRHDLRTVARVQALIVDTTVRYLRIVEQT
jgi:non-ribosomal peptide synthetase component F